MKTLLPSLLSCATLHAAILVELDPVTADYDGVAVDDGATAGGVSGIGVPTLADGFAFNLTFTPDVADLSGTVLLMEIGGTSNGSGLYLVDGVPTFIGKQGTNDAALPASLNDTTLPAIAVQSSGGALTAGSEYSFAATWDHAGNLNLALYDGTTLTPDAFTLTGTPADWSGNESLSVGLQTNNGSTGGLSGNNEASDFGAPFDVDLCNRFAFLGNICRALYWNDHAAIVDGSDELVRLDPGSATYDSSTDGNTFDAPGATVADGHTVRLELTPTAADLAGSTVLFEYGGTANGFAIILVDGVPTYCTKHNSGDNNEPDSLNDLSLRPNGSSSGEACVQAISGPLTAGAAYELAVAWDQAGLLQIGVTSGSGTVVGSFTLTGEFNNWAGNNKLGFGEVYLSAGGLGGELAGNTVSDPWDFDDTPTKAFAGTRTRALYWNDFAALNPGLDETSTLATDKLTIMGTENVVLSWSSLLATASGSVEITADKPVGFVSETGDPTAGTATYAVDGSFGNVTFTATFKNDSGGTVAVLRKLVEGTAAPGTLVRPWLGPEYFASPMFDWRRNGDRIECVTAGNNRRIDLLSRQLQPTSSLDMTVELARLDASFDGLAGFRFAAKGAIKTDYRHNIIQSFGFHAGLDTDGTLVLDDQSVAADFPLGAWQKLRLVLTPNGPNHDVTLEQLDPTNSAVLASVSKSIPSSEIVGNLLLLSDHPSINNNSAPWGSPVTAFRNWSHTGTDLAGSDDQHWGPILWTQYTLSKGTLKLSAQFAPLGIDENRTARLEIDTGSGWTQVDTAPIEQTTDLALFRIDNWPHTTDIPIRVTYLFGDTGSDVHREGLVRADPVDQESVSIAALACMRDLNFPNQEIVEGIVRTDPDVLFFSGDQFYENDYAYTPKIEAPFERARLDMLRKWFMFGWTFRDVMADRPSIAIVDDHDNWMANLWGSGGQALQGGLANGGYLMERDFVNATQRVQAAHLPDPYDFTTVDRGIEVYYTDFLYGRVSFAILEDRKFKTGPNEVGGAEFPTINDAELLSERQHDFIRDWARDWAGADFKATLCQTVFEQSHTHAGGGAEFAPIVADQDANGWPNPARNEAVRLLRKAFPVMIAGDNHLPTLSHIGVDAHEDAFLAYSSPATAVGFPRKWDPANDAATASTKVAGFPDYPQDAFDENPTFNGVPYLGRYTSDHGSPQTIVAIGNPVVWGGNTFGSVDLLADKSSGFGIVRFNKRTRDVTIEAYRIDADFSSPEPSQFDDWPVTVRQTDNYGRDAVAYLPRVEDPSFVHPVFEIIDESDDSLVYSIRSWTPAFRPHVFTPGGTYTVRYGSPETDTWVELTGQTPSAIPGVSIESFTASERFILAGDRIDLHWDCPGATSIEIDQGVGDVTLLAFNGIGTVSASPTSDTTYTLTADDGGSPLNATVTVRVFPTYEDWRELHFTPAELLDVEISGDTANPDGDIFDNHTEYLLQYDPRLPTRAPAGVIIPLDPGFEPRFELPEPLLPTHSWRLEQSETLQGAWTPLTEEETRRSAGALNPPSGTPTVILSPTAAWPLAESRQFLRANLIELAP